MLQSLLQIPWYAVGLTTATYCYIIWGPQELYGSSTEYTKLPMPYCHTCSTFQPLSPKLKELCLLPVKYQIIFKLNVTICKVLGLYEL